ncbi:MAG: hypothetical protein RLZZ387_868 [Chloroflexota bacterium]
MGTDLLPFLVALLVLIGLAGVGALVGVLLTMKSLARRIEKSQARIDWQQQQIDSVLPEVHPTALSDALHAHLTPLTSTMRAQTSEVSAAMSRIAEVVAATKGGVDGAAQRIGEGAADLRQTAAAFEHMAAALRDSQDQLRRAVELLAEPGSYQSWVAEIEGAVRPLRQASEGIHSHYETNRELISMTGAMLSNWDSQGGAVAEHAREVARLLEQWMDEEQAARRRIELTLDGRLAEVTQATAAQATGLSRLQGQIERMAATTDEMRLAMMQASEALSTFTATQQSQLASQRALVVHLGELSGELSRQQQSMGQHVADLAGQVTKLSDAAQQRQVALQQQTEDAVLQLSGQIQQLLDGARDSIDELADVQQSLLKRLARRFESLPHIGLQWTEVGVLALFCVVALVLLSGR